MAEDEGMGTGIDEVESASAGSLFDLSMKKKKKKKALVLEEEEDVVAEEVGDSGRDKDQETTEVAESAEGLGDLSLDDDSFDLSKKKKKKTSKKTLKLTSDISADMDDVDASDLEFGTKKKVKKKKKDEEGATDGDENGEKKFDSTYGPPTGETWDGRDYKYDELLGRVFRILHEHNPELGGQATKTILKPPQVLREGTKKTVFANFADLCKLMHRSNDHVLQYMMAELGTSGNLDGQSRLIIKGRFVPKDFEGVLRRYVNEYVMCNMCKSFDTVLTREQRLFILKCNNCGASRSVQAIKSGYQALVGKRSKVRAAAPS